VSHPEHLPFRIDILSLFPSYFRGPFDESIIKRALEKKLVDLHLIDVRDFAENKHHKVDDRPYGGGPGMVMMPDPLAKAIRSVISKQSKVIYMSPQGKPLTAAKCQELASSGNDLVVLCGHYEGIDERIVELFVDEEISIGDYVLTNGCLAAIVLVDAVVRFIPGVLGHELAAVEDSFGKDGILDCPHYTRPEDFEGHLVPKVLMSGNHKEIATWRRAEALKKTEQRRPDLLSK